MCLPCLVAFRGFHSYNTFMCLFWVQLIFLVGEKKSWLNVYFQLFNLSYNPECCGRKYVNTSNNCLAWCHLIRLSGGESRIPRIHWQGATCLEGTTMPGQVFGINSSDRSVRD